MKKLSALLLNRKTIYKPIGQITPPKTNMEPENDPWKRRFLLETIISRFHVCFRGCTTIPEPELIWEVSLTFHHHLG